MEPVTLEQLVKEVDIPMDKLEQRCTEEHLKSISLFLDWRRVAPHLGLSEADIGEIESDKRTDAEKRLEVLQKWKTKYGFKATFMILVSILLSIGNADHAEKVCRILLSEKETTLLSKLKNTLKLLQDCEDFKTLARSEVAQEAIQKFLKSSLQSGESKENLLDQLQKLHEEGLITKEMYEQAQELAMKMDADSLPAPSAKQSVSAPKEKGERLFCKDTVYHASLCCRLVSDPKVDAGNYQSFFKKKEVVPGHSFQKVSLSRAKQDRYLIAQQRDSILYFAFQSEPSLQKWKLQFKSFSEGIKVQSDKVPIRFLVELLNRRQSIILTGFSFGGLLACAVAALVWNSPYISSDLLKENLACITFGQPHVRVPFLPDVARQRPDLLSTIHCIYYHDDAVPYLMSFLDESCSSGAQLKAKGSKPISHYPIPEELRNPFHDPTTLLLLNHLSKIQEPTLQGSEMKPTAEEVMKALAELKSQLRPIAAGFKCPEQYTLCTYCISCDSSSGLIFTELEQQLVNQSNYTQAVEQFSIKLFEQHSMPVFQKGVFHGWLDRTPKYSLSDVSRHPPSDIDDLKPSVEKVEIRHHGSETAVVLEGSNLWFCSQASIGGYSLKTPACDLSGSSIQFNARKEKVNITTQNEKVKVTLDSSFSKPLKQEVSVNEKRYDVTTRQQQLARLTPPKLLELAYLCALLEQHPHGQPVPSSHKYEAITKFIKDAVHVVPFESILYAIVSSSDDVASICFKALTALLCSGSDFNLPPSHLMEQGVKYAIHRFGSGLPLPILQKMEAKANEQLPHNTRQGSQFTTAVVNTEEAIFTVEACFPFTATRIPTLKRTATMKLEDLKSTNIALSPVHTERIQFLKRLNYQVSKEADEMIVKGIQVDTVCGMDINVLYSISQTSFPQDIPFLRSPIDTLLVGRKKLITLVKNEMAILSESAPILPVETQQSIASCHYNHMMLETVNCIRKKELATCTALLGGFMEQQEIDIPLVKSQRDPSQVLALTASATVGVWALFSLNYPDIQPMLAKCQGDQLLVKIEDYIRDISTGDHLVPEDSQYAAKLQFMVQGIKKTVTCNSQYISYSLERQLTEVCKERKIDASISLSTLLSKWGKLFKENTLLLIAQSHRPLIARWLKWALMIHNLREELAKYTAVGVAGLVNSGKSVLVSTLFDIKIPVGTTEAKRTTVPFMYNLDENVEGLDVVDFPGVDDEDDSIPDLADLLVTITQIVIFVVDYRKVHTQSTKKWLERLQKENVPVLVCLTFADKLYAEHMSKDGKHPSKEHIEHQIKDQLSVITQKLGPTPSRLIRFFSFSQDRDSVLNCEEGRQRLRDVGIGMPVEVGDWLVDIFRKDFGQESLANQLEAFIHTQSLLD